LNTGINTGIPVLIFFNTEIPVLGNRAGIGGSTQYRILKTRAN